MDRELEAAVDRIADYCLETPCAGNECIFVRAGICNGRGNTISPYLWPHHLADAATAENPGRDDHPER